MMLTSLESMVRGDSLEQRCEILREAGFSGVDILGHTLAQRISEVKSATVATGIRLVAVYARLGTDTLLAATVRERARALDMLKERMETGAELGAAAVIFVPIFGPARIRMDAERTVLMVLLEELTTHGERFGVPLVLEPLSQRDTHLVYDPVEAVQLVREIGSPLLRTMVDTYHMDLQRLDMIAAVQEAVAYMSLIHVSDRDRKLPGRGGIDFPAVLSALSRMGFDGPVGLECDGAYDLEDLKRTADYLRGAWQGMSK